MGQSLEQYRQLSGVQPAHFIDREARPHMEAFMVGMMHYDTDSYTAAIEGFERALELYWVSESECRALCQGPQRLDGYGYLEYSPHLYEVIADHYGQVLRCQHECGRDLATRPGRLSPIDNYLPSHLDFLQYSYYQVGDHTRALEAVHSYLLFHPGDEAMEENLYYYSSHRHDPPISPRPDVLRYMERYQAEKQLLTSHSQELGALYIDPNHWISPMSQHQEMPTVSRPGSEEGVTEVRNSLDGRKRPAEKHENFKEGGPLLYSNIQLVSDSQGMNGSQRVLLDNVLTPQECGHLYSMARMITMPGDGYRGKTSPHTPNERFEGATVLKALTYGYEGRIPLLGARLFYDASEKARKIVQSYFMLNSTLYFSYTHLVCRSAIAGQQNNRNDLSHPIHADNCLLDPDANECWKEAPAYTYRDYSAILYLNGDFEGGEFIFTESDAKTITASVKPRCGRMVSFSSGGENPHGVRAVTKGQRCAVALWFTLDPVFREVERVQADEVVQQMTRERGADEEVGINPRDEL
ncbi:prolyl 3-hydroxylase 2 [Callorhinchus milii]|nr:prolyl 3-hydroxylase 2 [Callorhinchus milii]XP_042202552.1 prolyl 3-hydroxylase 2 [Callorhinchus milii]